jgi:hypothetical protein
MIIFVAFSSTITKSPDEVVEDTIIERPLNFSVDSLIFAFPASEYNNIVKIFENADFQAMRFEMYKDSITTITIGRINQYRFDYHYTLPDYHFMVIIDTVNNHKRHMLKCGKFVDDLILY